MDKRILMFLAAVPGFAVATDGAEKRKEERPNLLLIMTDQQRFDALGAVGKYSFLKTPNLDRLARESAWFTNAYTPCAVSGPARSCILTGQMVEHTNVLTNELTSQDPVANGFTTSKTFDQILAENGYYSEYHGKWHAPIGWTSCYRGFVWYNKNKKNPYAYEIEHIRKYKDYIKTKYGSSVAPEGTFIDNSMFGVPYRPDPIDRRILRGYGPDGKLLPEELARRIHTQPDNHGLLLLPDEDSFTAYQAREAIAAIHRADKENSPFNITLSINYPHAPMLPTETYYNMYRLDDMPVPESISDQMVDSPYITQNGRPQLPEYGDPSLIKYMMKNYFGLVSEIDYWVGEVLDALEKTGKADNTIVVFMSDHGEMLGAHGMREKNIFLEESARVPFMIRYPDKIRPAVVDDYVTTLDLFATIMDYTGVSEEKRDGASLRPVIEGKEHRKCVVTEWLYNGTRQPSHMIVKDGWKLFFNYSADSNVPPVLFNLEEDPYEMNNLIGQHNPDRDKYLPKAEDLKQEMLEWLEQRNSSYVDDIKEVVFR